jgi:hypothetical protein
MSQTSIAAKLKAVRVSGKFAAILACMVGEEWTTPSLVELAMTSDGFLLGRRKGDIGLNELLGAEADLIRNLKGVAEVAELTTNETLELLALAPYLGKED